MAGLSQAMTWMVQLHRQLSSSAKAGDPVRRGFSVLSSASLEYWVARRPKPSLRAKRSNPSHHAKKEWIASSQVLLAMTADTVSRSRGTMRPRFASYFRDLWKSEGAGNAGCALHPRSHAQCVGRCAHEHTGQRRQSDIPCAMALRLITRSPR